jgi:hypothetical protein
VSEENLPMTGERRYDEEEVKRIFEAASTAAEAPRGALTLRELQDIGHQVGIAPALISEAALAIDASRPLEPPSAFPVTVRQTTRLSRAPTDAEWRILVSDLRETFDAPGKLGQSAGSYEWRNGNLHAYIEPTTAGYRLRMGTRNSGIVTTAIAGAAAIAWSAAAVVGLAEPGDFPLIPAIVSFLGAGAIGTSVFRLRSWARTRAAQMQRIAGRARALLGG